MEIFERLAWYGFFTVSSLYMTTPLAHGGLGLSDNERGFLQGIVPFILYILPVFTGALADRYGYRKMFIISLIIMSPSYFLLGQVKGFWTFCAMFTLVALGAALFKPIAVGTVGRCTDESNRGLGFGIFYMMINVGGFIGPIVAGYVRAISWDLVFAMSSFWILISIFPAVFFYRDPPKSSNDTRSITQVFMGAREVLGNVRLLIFVIPLVAALVLLAKDNSAILTLTFLVVGWIAINAIWSYFVSKRISRAWYSQPIKMGDAHFVAYLLVLSIFWAVYYQIFLTLPLYIRDFVDTSDLVDILKAVNPAFANILANVNVERVTEYLVSVKVTDGAASESINAIKLSLATLNVLVPDEALQYYIATLKNGQIDPAVLASQLVANYRQIAPEYIINVEFLVIILFQILISGFAQRFRSLPVLITGISILALSTLLIAISMYVSEGGAIVLFAVVVFATAEMIASPKSQEYVASISPPDRTAMFMGYYFISMALGNLFAGLLSGWSYSSLARKANQPVLMWVLFAALALISAVAMIVLDRRMRARHFAASAVRSMR